MKKTYKEISEALNIPVSTIGYIVQKFKTTGLIKRLCGSGRKKSLTKDEIGVLCEQSLNKPKNTRGELVEEIKKRFNKVVSKTTIGRELNKNEIYGRIARKKPLLSKKNIIQRFELSKFFFTITERQWKTVLFSDESTFELFSSKKRQYVWRKNGNAFDLKNLVPTVKFGGGKIMVWGCISYHGVGNLVFVDGTLDSGKYINLLSNNLGPSAAIMNLKDFIFQQDGAPCHTSKATMQFFENNKIKLLNWAAQSPDLNPIEHVWMFMKTQVNKIPCKNLSELKEKIKTVWNNIPKEFVQKLINGMYKRSYAVFKAKGRHTKY